MLSQYLRAEVPDHGEPVSFYAPGAKDWSDRLIRIYRARVMFAQVDGPGEREARVAPDPLDQ